MPSYRAIDRLNTASLDFSAYTRAGFGDDELLGAFLPGLTTKAGLKSNVKKVARVTKEVVKVPVKATVAIVTHPIQSVKTIAKSGGAGAIIGAGLAVLAAPVTFGLSVGAIGAAAVGGATTGLLVGGAHGIAKTGMKGSDLKVDIGPPSYTTAGKILAAPGVISSGAVEHPVVTVAGAVKGAIEGYSKGGVEGAAMGLLTGGGKTAYEIKKAEEAARKAQPAVEVSKPPEQNLQDTSSYTRVQEPVRSNVPVLIAGGVAAIIVIAVIASRKKGG